MNGDDAMNEPLGPPDASAVPRFAGPATFARLPRPDQVPRADVAVLGLPFDSGVCYRPGARFGPEAVRAGSKLLRPYHPALDAAPWSRLQVADAGDATVNPFDTEEAIDAVHSEATELYTRAEHLVAIGGDHIIVLPLPRVAHARYRPVALVHFDPHLDIVGADVAEVSPAYEHAQLTALAAVDVVYELLGLFALRAK